MNAMLKPEGGVTDISLENARLLLEAHGLPEAIELYQHPLYEEGAEHLVEARWTDGTTHVFSGFAWGYTGDGPYGLETFLALLHCQPTISIRSIAGWPQEHFPALTFIRGEDYGYPALPTVTPSDNGSAPAPEPHQEP